MNNLISAVIFLPLAGALLALFLSERLAKVVCTAFAFLTLAVSIPLATNYQHQTSLDKFYADTVDPQAIQRAEVKIVRTAADGRDHEETLGFTNDIQKKAAQARLVAEKNERRKRAQLDMDPSAANKAAFEKAAADLSAATNAFRDCYREGYREAEYELLYAKYSREVTDMHDAADGLYGKTMKFIEFRPWIPTFRINYFVGLDGLSLPLVLLTTLLTVLCLVYSWTFDYDKPAEDRRPLKAFYILFLLLETGLVGVFCALDFFLFFVFWEIVLLPSYFLIGIWGGENRNYASIKFFIYTLVGSITMLIAMLALYFHFEPHTFNVLSLIEQSRQFGGTAMFSTKFQLVIFALLFLGFAIKVPVFPFHTWLPDAHVQAPTAFSVMLAGVMLKMGGYGFFRFSFPMCHDAAITQTMVWVLGILGAINIVYGAFVAMGQSDFKSLVAYSSVSHMGYVLLGMAAVTAAGLDGAALQMINHGVSSAGMFFIVGIIYDRAHHRDLNKFGGIALQMPRYFGFSLVILFASLGLPGLCGFISEAFVFLGAWQSTVLPKWIVLFSTLGILLGAAYILWTIRRVFLGPLTVEKYKHFPDLELRETFALLPLVVLCVVIGVYPRFVLDTLGLNSSIDTICLALGIPGFGN